MDGRSRVLRPRTRQADNELLQPVGTSGYDPIASRTLDPVRTFETPLVYFPQEIVVGSGVVLDIPLPARCAQIAFISVIPNVQASINQGGPRTIKDGFVYNGEFTSLTVATDGAGSCIIQLACY